MANRAYIGGGSQENDPEIVEQRPLKPGETRPGDKPADHAPIEATFADLDQHIGTLTSAMQSKDPKTKKAAYEALSKIQRAGAVAGAVLGGSMNRLA